MLLVLFIFLFFGRNTKRFVVFAILDCTFNADLDERFQVLDKVVKLSVALVALFGEWYFEKSPITN